MRKTLLFNHDLFCTLDKNYILNIKSKYNKKNKNNINTKPAIIPDLYQQIPFHIHLGYFSGIWKNQIYHIRDQQPRKYNFGFNSLNILKSSRNQNNHLNV